LKVPGVNQTTAGKKKQVIVMDGIKLSNFGPRLGEAVKELAENIYSNTAAN
jgi:iron complex transport system substrate-binding protein